MNRSDLVNEIASRFGDIEKKDSEVAVRLIFEAMAAAIASGRRIEIRNFGVLQARIRPNMTYRNPRTGERLDRRSTCYVRFKEGKELRKRITDSDFQDGGDS